MATDKSFGSFLFFGERIEKHGISLSLSVSLSLFLCATGRFQLPHRFRREDRHVNIHDTVRKTKCRLLSMLTVNGIRTLFYIGDKQAMQTTRPAPEAAARNLRECHKRARSLITELRGSTLSNHSILRGSRRPAQLSVYCRQTASAS